MQLFPVINHIHICDQLTVLVPAVMRLTFAADKLAEAFLYVLDPEAHILTTITLFIDTVALLSIIIEMTIVLTAVRVFHDATAMHLV